MKSITLISIFLLSAFALFAQSKQKLEVALCGLTGNDALENYTPNCVVEIMGTSADAKPEVNKFTVVIAPKIGEAEFFPVIGDKMPETINDRIKNFKSGDMLIITEVQFTYLNTGDKKTIPGPSFVKE